MRPGRFCQGAEEEESLKRLKRRCRKQEEDECMLFIEEVAQGYRYHYTQTKAVSQALVKAAPWGILFYNCNPYVYMIQNVAVTVLN